MRGRREPSGEAGALAPCRTAFFWRSRGECVHQRATVRLSLSPLPSFTLLPAKGSDNDGDVPPADRREQADRLGRGVRLQPRPRSFLGGGTSRATGEHQPLRLVQRRLRRGQSRRARGRAPRDRRSGGARRLRRGTDRADGSVAGRLDRTARAWRNGTGDADRHLRGRAQDPRLRRAVVLVHAIHPAARIGGATGLSVAAIAAVARRDGDVQLCHLGPAAMQRGAGDDDRDGGDSRRAVRRPGRGVAGPAVHRDLCCRHRPRRHGDELFDDGANADRGRAR